MDIAVLGAGSWGTALSFVLADNGHRVHLWARRKELAAEINGRRTNERYLPGCTVPESVQAYTDLGEAVHGVRHVVLAVPSQTVGEVATQLNGQLEPDAYVLHAVKGIDVKTGRRMSEVILDACPGLEHRRLAVLSGPSHAEEVARRLPTTVVVAGFSPQGAEVWQSLLMNLRFRVYTHSDVVGVELGGSLKNIIAIGVGLSDGLGFGDNAKAALMTRGLHEIARLGFRLGAVPLTFAGLAGVGDLIVTCTSRHSRNRRAGLMLAEGRSLDEVLQGMGMVVEGVYTTRAAVELSEKAGVEMPIAKATFAVLFEKENPRRAVEELMGRTPKQEWVADLWQGPSDWSRGGDF
ncbi:NAD(P)H-dependent glycerol-3-phosphate dehydrogenase [Kyrpidia spormannii]|uniref:NADPH-dependent glycerol-3-phosphate dehydrogenase n=1 Tax=Kyrpidia spormannii TaxID=2055160 RepID=A0ACA8Z8F1_9BACL|nr:NAD(P)H-dependent glycerol-3-phosphate dehydrogenase [Kyrpidia spormannii]CAB3391996.1 NADPH-dependent glycerol-3-phosphate dehydrogenase [Kyrpidia spormannii]